MDDSADPLLRAAVWYVAGFGALASFLLGGTSLTGFTWAKAAHPLAAVAVAVVAVGLAAAVVALAARVLTPRYGIDDLVERQDKVEHSQKYSVEFEKVRQQPIKDVDQELWKLAASLDRVLKYLYVNGYFRASNDAPKALQTRADDPNPTIAAESENRLQLLVTSANRGAARRTFTIVQFFAPIASLIILLCALLWPSVSSNVPDVASASEPIPVSVSLNPTQDPARLIGAGCTLRSLSGVAISGELDASPLVAIPAQGSCPSALIRVSSLVGDVSRTD